MTNPEEEYKCWTCRGVTIEEMIKTIDTKLEKMKEIGLEKDIF